MISHVVMRSRRLPASFLLAALSLLSLCATLSPLEAQEWRVNKAKSQVSFAIAMDGQPVQGQFGNFKVDIRFDPEEPADGEIVASLDAGSVRTGDPARDAALTSADWLNAAAHPAIRIASLNIKEQAAGSYSMSANLTIKGVTKRVTIPVTIADQGAGSQIEAEIRADGGAFGVGTGGNEITIGFNLTATNPTN
jgi:polyisoprenoid-binding protein YceI